jgi:hypothetical protein
MGGISIDEHRGLIGLDGALIFFLRGRLDLASLLEHSIEGPDNIGSRHAAS